MKIRWVLLVLVLLPLLVGCGCESEDNQKEPLWSGESPSDMSDPLYTILGRLLLVLSAVLIVIRRVREWYTC